MSPRSQLFRCAAFTSQELAGTPWLSFSNRKNSFATDWEAAIFTPASSLTTKWLTHNDALVSASARFSEGSQCRTWRWSWTLTFPFFRIVMVVWQMHIFLYPFFCWYKLKPLTRTLSSLVFGSSYNVRACMVTRDAWPNNKSSDWPSCTSIRWHRLDLL